MSSAEMASGYVRRMVEAETRGWGDQSNALNRIEQRYGIPFWTLNHLRSGRAKTVEATIFERIRAAYLDLCERQIAKLQHEISVEKALHHDDIDQDIEREAEALLARVLAKRGRI